ncbi:MAG TPA: PHB depolymerase family esterase [Kofleriaceae bacterium]|nr:PHB depolymerase family esterase [Kofleriaceae bacterium]
MIAASLVQVTSFGSNPGSLQMYEYVPTGMASGRPLVVVLHGCTQTASSMVEAGWNALADQDQFAVMYPQQTSSNNPVECFNWAGNYGNDADLVRGQGENASIEQMVEYEIATHGVDASRVYIAGFSAGAAFTAVMLATWPDKFQAGAIMEGIPYRCATTVAGAYQCQNPGVTQDASAWGDLVRAADSGYSGPWPRVQIWEGTSDTTVVPANEAELVKQWTNVWGTDQTADSTDMVGSAATHAEYKAGSVVAVETYTVSGMDHAVAIGSDSGESEACPGTDGQYFEDHGICSTLRAAQFFGLIGGGSGSGSGSGSGNGNGNGGSDGGVGAGGGCDAGMPSGGSDEPGSGSGSQALPACSMNAARADGRGWLPIAMAFVVAVRIGRRRRAR